MTGIINPYTNDEYRPIEEPTLPPDPEQAPPRRGYRPSPGRVTVMRRKADEFYSREAGIVKPRRVRLDAWGNESADFVEMEEAFDIYATVVTVGKTAPGGMAPWFKKGDVVTIEPSLFRPVELSADLTLWLGPFAGITGAFTEDVADEPEGDPED